MWMKSKSFDSAGGRHTPIRVRLTLAFASRPMIGLPIATMVGLKTIGTGASLFLMQGHPTALLFAESRAVLRFLSCFFVLGVGASFCFWFRSMFLFLIFFFLLLFLFCFCFCVSVFSSFLARCENTRKM